MNIVLAKLLYHSLYTFIQTIRLQQHIYFTTNDYREMNTKILLCIHKPGPFLQHDMFLPIHVGKALSSQQLNIQGDDTGDNISHKNREFCELTAHYWAWKNLQTADYIGLFHYRRYLDLDHRSLRQKNTISAGQLTTPQQSIEKALQDCDILLSNPYYYSVSNKIAYCYAHIREDYHILENVIHDLYPEYLSAFQKIMLKRNWMSVGNLLITKREIFNAYSAWLFDILFEVEKRIKISPYPYQQRVFGFMSERLLDVYCYHHRLKTKRYPVLFINEGEEQPKNKTLLAFQFKRFLKTLRFRCSSKHNPI